MSRATICRGARHPAGEPAAGAGGGHAGASKPFLRFETLTLAPFDRRLIDPEMLDAAELAWLNAYHARVLAEVGPHLDAPTRAWLAAACDAHKCLMFHRFRIGDHGATVVSDGPLVLPAAARIFAGPTRAALNGRRRGGPGSTRVHGWNRIVCCWKPAAGGCCSITAWGPRNCTVPTAVDYLGSLGEAGVDPARSMPWC